MKLNEIDIKSLIIGIVISIACIIIGHLFTEWAYPFTAIGFLYIGFKAKNIKYAMILGAITSIPLIVLAFYGYLGELTGFFESIGGKIVLIIIIIVVGAFLGFIGGLAKRDRVKAIEEYEKKQNIGKNKKKKKKNNN